MSEYKLLKEFSDIVPGMKFKAESNDVLLVLRNENVGFFAWSETTHHIFLIHPNICIERFALIYDPRKGSNMIDIRERIEEHKKQIKILENQLQDDTLKNIFVYGNVYKIKRRNVSGTILAKFHKLSCDNLYIIYFPGYGIEEEMLLSGIEKVWKIDNVNDLFVFNKPIFERC